MSSKRQFFYYILFTVLLSFSFILFSYYFSKVLRENSKEKDITMRESQLKLDRKKLEDDIEVYKASVKLLEDYDTAVEIQNAKKILKDVEDRSDEFKEGFDLCMKDVESIHSADSSTVIFRNQYCKDRSLRYLGYETTFSRLRLSSSKPYPSTIFIKGVTDGASK